MNTMNLDDLRQRKTPVELTSQEFRTLGYRLVDRIAGHFETLANRRVTPGESPEVVRRAIRSDNGLPTTGTESGALLDEITELLLEHSVQCSPASGATLPQARPQLACWPICSPRGQQQCRHGSGAGSGD